MKEICINGQKPGNSLWQRLQKKTLEEIQGMAGQQWTDYNAHDPGVTMADILNYALTELDYRLGFGLPDYLSEKEETPDFRKYGLFAPEEIFPVSPVTAVDYRKLMTDAVEEVDNLWIYPAGKVGWYDLLVELTPDAETGSREKVREQLLRLFHANRNLCEGIKNVLFIERKPLVLQGDISIAPDVDAPLLLAKIYWEAIQFFSTGVRYRKVDELLAEGMTPDELLDGPDLKHWAIDTQSLKRLPSSYSISRLYRRLSMLEGVLDIRFLGFREEGKIHTDLLVPERPDCSYTVHIPERKEEAVLRLLVGDVPVEPDLSHLSEMLYAEHARSYGYQNRTKNLKEYISVPGGTCRKIYRHDSIQNDFPECYGINRMGVPRGASDLRKAQARQLKAFLLLFDEVFARGLKELENIPTLLNVDGNVADEGVVDLPAPEVMWDTLVIQPEKTVGSHTRQVSEKGKWADMLDRMYGENSNPAWLKTYDFYKESAGENLKRRFGFLSRIPEWGRNRFKAIDLYRNQTGNIPGIKAYVSALLGFEIAGEHPVVNIFPRYNLRLVEDDWFYQFQKSLLSHNLVPEESIQEGFLERIPRSDQEPEEGDYKLLRQNLPLLHYNLLFEGLFREGIHLENYRVLNLPLQTECLLIFYHSARKEWVNLGRFSSRNELIATANSLRRFLLMLNRKSETLYVVEHLFLNPDDGFAITVVLPGWSARMADAGFREACEKLICSRMPAHLILTFRWFSPARMWEFERAYYEWRRLMVGGGDVTTVANQLKNIIV